jgi:hypothetical protein
MSIRTPPIMYSVRRCSSSKVTRLELIATHNMELAVRMDRRVSLMDDQFVELDWVNKCGEAACDEARSALARSRNMD